jgi:hypothetical protein
MKHKGYISPEVNKEKRIQYQNWINEHVPDDCKRYCRSMCEEMICQFNELRMVGFVGLYSDHAWCLDNENNIIDPTFHQFDYAYKHPDQYLESKDFPTGKCIWCGELIWPDTDAARFFTGDEVGPHVKCNEQLKLEYATCNKK